MIVYRAQPQVGNGPVCILASVITNTIASPSRVVARVAHSTGRQSSYGDMMYQYQYSTVSMCGIAHYHVASKSVTVEGDTACMYAPWFQNYSGRERIGTIVRGRFVDDVKSRILIL